jgi:hypothetical protein
MPNYKIEGDINFYESLYNSLDYDSENEDNKNDKNDKKQICEISGLELKDRFVTLECNHTFNYDALYTEICKQKFDFQTYTMDTMSKKDIQAIRDKKIDYFIKCPYCRNIQFTLLPHYDDLPFVKKYGVNTDDPDFRVIKTFSSYNVSSNHTFTLYGYPFSKGTCCKTNLINGKNVPCWQKYTTPIIAPDNSTKELCTIHVRPEVKEFKLQIKKKIMEEKLLAKEQAKALKIKALEEKALKAKDKKLKPTLLCVSCKCTAILKTGSRKGEACDKNALENNLCKRHSK